MHAHGKEVDALIALYRHLAGTPENTRRAYARDLAYLAAWKQATFAAALTWPQSM